MTEEFDDLHCEYGYASGLSDNDCVYIGRRWRDQYGTTLSDSDFSSLFNKPDTESPVYTGLLGPRNNILTGIWRALPSNITYLADASVRRIHVYDDITDTFNVLGQSYELDFAPEGIWGLDDEHVYTWGVRRDASNQLELPIARWDGKEWSEMPSPGFAISKIHGLAPDLLYAAGQSGGMARYDGRQWIDIPMPTGETFSDVFVAHPDEIYATGLNGSLLEGSRNGWSTICRTLDDRLPYACVAKFNDELWVGGASLGLFRRIGKTNELELVKPKISATHFDSRGGALLVTTPTRVASTEDGASFYNAGVNTLIDMTNTQDICER